MSLQCWVQSCSEQMHSSAPGKGVSYLHEAHLWKAIGLCSRLLRTGGHRKHKGKRLQCRNARMQWQAGRQDLRKEPLQPV